MDELQRDGMPEPALPCWATCGNCGRLFDLSDYTGIADEDEYGMCLDDLPPARVRRDFKVDKMPCGGERWAG